MARKPKKASPKSSADPLTRVLDAALAEAATVGWAQVSLEAVAQRAGLTLGAVLTLTPTKVCLVTRLIDRVDAAVLASVDGVDHSQPVKDRLFDLLMRRFDALQKDRAGILAVMRGVRRDPALAAAILCRASRSAAAMLNAAGVSTDGLIGLARIAGLKAVFLAALRAWRSDESSDMAKTMAVLDKALSRAEQAANFIAGRRTKQNEEAEG